MVEPSRRSPLVLTRLPLLVLAFTKTLHIIVTGLLVASTLGFACFAQDQPAQDQAKPEPSASPSQEAPTSEASGKPPSLVVPAGTRLSMVLTSSVSSRMLHRGDNIQAQMTSPIPVGDQVAIPAGTYIQGSLDKMRRDGNRAEITLQSASVIFPDGYVAHIAGPIHIESDEGTAWANPGSVTRTGMILAPAVGLGLGAAIGSAAHTTDTHVFAGQTITTNSVRGVAIGSVVGLAAGAAVSFVLLARNHQFYMEVGSPMQMTVPEPITLAQDEVSNANRAAMQNPPPPPAPPAAPPVVPVAFPSAPANHGTCFTPGTPGTPTTVIPGAPGPNGIPGPPTVIPGTPAVPAMPYPCP